jgi:HK97 family phage major capsid protein/HK97 family phage prohead protease
MSATASDDAEVINLATPRTGPAGAPAQNRAAAFERAAVNVEARTVELAVASEEPYDRWWGREVLSMDRSAVRLGRLGDGRHPLLVDHNTRDQVGVVERAWLGEDRRLRASVRFGNSARAKEIFQDVADGIRSLVSVGYRIHEMKLLLESDAGDEYLVTDWEPHEVSVVAVPADPTVGIGRGGESELQIRSLIQRTRNPSPSPIQSRKESNTMTTETIETKPAAATVEPQPIDARREREQATAAERQRVRDITALGEKFGQREQATAAIEAGTAYDAFREAVFTGMERSGALKLAEPAEIGLTRKEVQAFRFTNLIAATLWPDDATVRKLAGFEVECARAAADKRDHVAADRAGAFTIPLDVLGQALDMRSVDAETATRMLLQRAAARARVGQRDLLVGTSTAGGHTVATDLLASSFIDILTAEMRLMSMGATVLNGLAGNVAIPRATSGSTGYWVAENGATTESQQAFDQVALTPKTVGAFTDYSRRLLLQSSISIEAFVRMDIARTIALAIDLAGIAGSGSSNQPRGILNVSGIGSVPGGTNGAAPTWDHIVDLETAVANANSPTSSLGYLTNTRVRGRLKRTQMFSGTNGMPVWNGNEMNGVRAEVSNQVPNTLTKGSASGVCSAIIYGNFADLIIGMWGGLDIMLDPYTGATAGTKRVVALQDVDVAVRYATSFAAMQDALTV